MKAHQIIVGKMYADKKGNVKKVRSIGDGKVYFLRMTGSGQGFVYDANIHDFAAWAKSRIDQKVDEIKRCRDYIDQTHHTKRMLRDK